ncbi:MAG: hypothetical protein GY771_09405 [bacterium]|nr:hypothetical protein [bacterium]
MKVQIITSLIIMFFTLGGSAMAKTEVAYPKPAEEGDFTVFAYSADRVFVLDSTGKIGYSLDTVKKSTVGRFKPDVAMAKASTWAGKELWILDQETEKIYQVESKKGTVLRSIPAPKPEGEGEWSYEGLAWDGEYLWVTYFAGFSSKIHRVNPQNGEVVQSFYADAHPRGLYCDGKNLWTLCYNGSETPSVIDKRVIAADGFDTFKSREFIGKVGVSDPRGLAFDGERFLTMDLSKGEVVTFKPAQ